MTTTSATGSYTQFPGNIDKLLKSGKDSWEQAGEAVGKNETAVEEDLIKAFSAGSGTDDGIETLAKKYGVAVTNSKGEKQINLESLQVVIKTRLERVSRAMNMFLSAMENRHQTLMRIASRIGGG